MKQCEELFGFLVCIDPKPLEWPPLSFWCWTVAGLALVIAVGLYLRPRPPVMKPLAPDWIDRYVEWTRAQHCIDCGTPASERSQAKPWVTETQCMACWRQYGPPETRGLPSASQSFPG